MKINKPGMLTACMFAGISLVAQPQDALADNDVATLRQQLDEQRALIEGQKELLQIQQQRIDQQMAELSKLSSRLGQMESSMVSTTESNKEAAVDVKESVQAVAHVSKAEEDLDNSIVRDAVGDLNAEAVGVGEFPGSFRIPGGKGVSLAIGGSIKTAAIYDTDAEAMGASFTPAGMSRDKNKHGAMSLDATLTRMFLDGRVTVPMGKLRGYVEYDLNAKNDGNLDFKIRHAYGSWATDNGTLLAGHTWSTMMDLKILPEGLTEPTVSGVIFARQTQLRWSQALGPAITLHLAAEDPSSSDVDTGAIAVKGITSMPDLIAALDFDRNQGGHLRLGAIARRLEVDAGKTSSEIATGVALTGHLDLFAKDKLVFSSVYGKGLGRYLLGIQSSAGALVNPINLQLDTRTNWGAMLAYKHQWNEDLRSTLMTGYASADNENWQPSSTFENSTYASINLMWKLQPFMTVGVEYGYGRSEFKGLNDLDNHRIGVGMQIY